MNVFVFRQIQVRAAIQRIFLVYRFHTISSFPSIFYIIADCIDILVNKLKLINKFPFHIIIFLDKLKLAARKNINSCNNY